MKTLRFKTNLKCNGCVKAITPGMDSLKEINDWRIFLDTEEKILEVYFEDSSEKEIVNQVLSTVSKTGYDIEKL